MEYFRDQEGVLRASRVPPGREGEVSWALSVLDEWLGYKTELDVARSAVQYAEHFEEAESGVAEPCYTSLLDAEAILRSADLRAAHRRGDRAQKERR